MDLDFSICKGIEAVTLPTGRTYKTPAGNFPSITTILGKTAYMPWLDAWKKRVGEEEAARISKIATDRGTLIHEYLERYWNKEEIREDLAKEPRDIRLMTNQLVYASKKSITEVWAQELAVWDEELKVAGRLDMLGKWNGIPAVIDFKTSKKKKRAGDIKDYYVQVASYAKSCNQLFNLNIKKLVILITVETGDMQVFEGFVAPYLPDLRHRINQYYELEK